jgi:hypothetical protein
MKRKAVIVALLVVVCCLLIAQDDYEAWKQKQQEQLKEYKSVQDKAFVEFLEKNWEAFEAFKGEKRDEAPKIPVAPVATTKKKMFEEVKQIKNSEQKSHNEEMESEEHHQNIKSEESEHHEADNDELNRETTDIEVETDIVQEIDEPTEKPIEEEVIVMQVEEQVEKNSLMLALDKTAPTIDVTFWGLPITYNYQTDLEVELSPLDGKAVANFWYVTSNTSFEDLLDQMLDSKDKMNLNDWGYCLLLNEVGKKIANCDQNLTRLFIWFMLTKSGYECKVGYNDGKVFLLLPSANTIYGVSFVEIDDKRYYALSFEGKEKIDFAINTYDGKYPNADDLIDLGITESPRINQTIVEKELKFTYANTEYTIPVRYDQNAAEFFRDYPQTNLDVYFNAPLSPEATQSLMQGLKPIIADQTETQAANILLRFVQTAFEYQTDGDQFGREKSFFSDETLFYPYCDCEDRSIIFSYLIRQILERQVVGLDYPGHIATGVNFDSEVIGDNIMVKGVTYTICDPTYINADLGMAMPQFKDVAPKIIVLGKE